MDRRNFLRSLIGGVAASAAVRTFPFRVYSFPTEITPSELLYLHCWSVDWKVKPLYDIYAVAEESRCAKQTLFTVLRVA